MAKNINSNISFNYDDNYDLNNNKNLLDNSSNSNIKNNTDRDKNIEKNLKFYYKSLNNIYTKYNIKPFNEIAIEKFLNNKISKFKSLLNKIELKFKKISKNIFNIYDSFFQLNDCIIDKISIDYFVNIDTAAEIIDNYFRQIIDNYKEFKNLYLKIKDINDNKISNFSNDLKNIKFLNNNFNNNNNIKMNNFNINKSYSMNNFGINISKNNSKNMFIIKKPNDNSFGNNNIINNNYNKKLFKTSLYDNQNNNFIKKKRQRCFYSKKKFTK